MTLSWMILDQVPIYLGIDYNLACVFDVEI